MKKQLFGVVILSLVSLMHASAVGTVLFSDSFDRPNNQDLDAGAPMGMGGVLGTMTYVERDEVLLSGTATALGLSNIENNTLHLADGPNMSVIYLDHNFTDAEFLAADGMKIGMTIVSNDGTLTDFGRFFGFGVGSTQAEASTAELDWTTGAPSAFRGSAGASVAGHADFYVDWNTANGGYLEVFKNGPTPMGGEHRTVAPNIALTGSNRLELELYFEDFNDGSPVSAVILWDGQVVATDRFAWDADGLLENYLGITCRQNGAGFTADDLAVEAIYNGRAQNPSPDGSGPVAPFTVTLQWDKGKDAAGSPNADITRHYVYVTTEMSDGEPNFLSVDTDFYTVDDPSTSQPIAIDYDLTYYWRVDESVLVNGAPSGPNDPNTITGLVWQFDALKSYPIINSDPVHAAVFPGEPASFAVSAASVSDIHYAWYKSRDNAADTLADDVPVGGDEATLTIDPVTIADEGYYYCKVTNTGTGEEGAQYTVPAYLTVKRQVLHWSFEDNFLDSSGEGYDGVVDSDPNFSGPTFAANVPGAVGLKSAQFNGENQRLTAPIDPNHGTFHAGYTLTMWVYPAVLNQGLNVAMFNNNNGGNFDFQVDFNGAGQLRYQGTQNQVIMDPVTDWIHIAVVCDGTTTTIYHDLEGSYAVVSNGADNVFGQFQVGCNRAGDTFFEGLIDEVQVWNYPRTYEEMVSAADDSADYYDVTQKSACQTYPALDLDGDCVVTLSDFMKLAETWLNCGLYPQTECQ